MIDADDDVESDADKEIEFVRKEIADRARVLASIEEELLGLEEKRSSSYDAAAMRRLDVAALRTREAFMRSLERRVDEVRKRRDDASSALDAAREREAELIGETESSTEQER